MNQNISISSDSINNYIAYDPVKSRMSKKNQQITRPELFSHFCFRLLSTIYGLHVHLVVSSFITYLFVTSFCTFLSIFDDNTIACPHRPYLIEYSRASWYKIEYKQAVK